MPATRSSEREELNGEHGRVLLALARRAVAAALGREEAAEPAVVGEAWLRHPSGSFVTLTRDGLLRGCVGTIRSQSGLGEGVERNAGAAAFEDPRFPPLTAGELDHVRFEVSVLSPLARLEVASEEDLLRRLEAGRHGLVLEWGPHRGVFLPQMWEQLPEPEAFVRHLKRKANLPEDAWSPEITLWTFTVQCWHEPAGEGGRE